MAPPEIDRPATGPLGFRFCRQGVVAALACQPTRERTGRSEEAAAQDGTILGRTLFALDRLASPQESRNVSTLRRMGAPPDRGSADGRRGRSWP